MSADELWTDAIAEAARLRARVSALMKEVNQAAGCTVYEAEEIAAGELSERKVMPPPPPTAEPGRWWWNDRVEAWQESGRWPLT